MVQGFSHLEDAYDGAQAESELLLAVPRAVVRGRDGKSRWVAQCPRCVERQEEGLIVGDGDNVRVECKACGAIVEVRESSSCRVAATVPPPEE